MAHQYEEELTDCPFCGAPVRSLWVPQGGCLPSPDYVLVADWIIHTDCWDKRIEEHPP
jgi:hypothetical protein